MICKSAEYARFLQNEKYFCCKEYVDMLNCKWFIIIICQNIYFLFGINITEVKNESSNSCRRYGTRISEESQNKPKPMIELGGYPILWHIMKTYSHYGYNEFVICAGYKQYAIKEYFANYFLHCSDVTFDFTASNKMTVHSEHAEPWKVTVVNTAALIR